MYSYQVDSIYITHRLDTILTNWDEAISIYAVNRNKYMYRAQKADML